MLFKNIHFHGWFLWSLGVLLVVGAVLLASIQQSSVELERQTAQLFPGGAESWQDVHSEVLGLNVSYPSSWQAERVPHIPESLALRNPENAEENVAIYLVEAQFERPIRAALGPVEESQVVVDGRRAFWMRPDSSNVVLIPDGENLYFVGGQSGVFRRILDSLKFVK